MITMHKTSPPSHTYQLLSDVNNLPHIQHVFMVGIFIILNLQMFQS